MKKIIVIFFILELIIILQPTYSIADNKSEIIESQKQNLKISDFTKEAQKYTKESMPGIDLNDLLSTAITGKIDNIKFMTLFWKLLRKRNYEFSRNFKQYYCNCGNTFYIKKYQRKSRKSKCCTGCILYSIHNDSRSYNDKFCRSN